MLMVLLAAAGLLSLPPQATADTRPSSPGAASPLIFVDQSGQPSIASIVIDEASRRILYDYYQRHLQQYQASPEYRQYEDEDQNENQNGNGKKNGNGHGKNKGLPPGLAKKSTLPPGLQKQLARNGQLPPGLQYRALPPDLLVQLPPVSPGYRYVILDDRVILIRAATNVIMDLLQVPGL
ncbi:MAG TPA: hypothetical protein VL462_00650 [Candidatus Nitrosotalea sp.]|jgi:hypothetical protein|nr:hypothetical protein [Candidatus Nitrosotalea sp.]